MYTPKHFQEKDQQRLLAFMKQYPFGIVVSTVGGRTWATHLPFTIEMALGQVSLFAHIALANSQWKELSDGGEVMVIFSGPHAFISPSHYDSPQNVPTWDYIAVHAYGKVQLIHEREGKLNILNKMIVGFDPAYAQQFTKLTPNYLEAHLDGIVALTINITEMQGQYKLSQNKNPHERNRIIARIAQEGDAAAADLALRMKEYPFKEV